MSCTTTYYVIQSQTLHYGHFSGLDQVLPVQCTVLYVVGARRQFEELTQICKPIKQSKQQSNTN
jgi:hypothetical protein